MVNHLLAMDPGDVVQQIDGIPTTEPAFNLPALWIPMEREEDAKFAGYTVVDNSTVIATHLTELIRNSAYELLCKQDVQHLLDNLSKTSSKAVEELVPQLMSLGMLQKVLQNLLKERASIRDLLTIVETLGDYAPMSKDTDLLTEYVRQKVEKSTMLNVQPIVLCAPAVRRHMRKIVEQYVPSAMVISHAEIVHNISIKVTGKVVI